MGFVEKYRRYGLLESIRLSVWILRTRLIAPNARLIRFPIDIRGRAHITFGAGLTTGRYCRFEALPKQGLEAQAVMHFGKNLQMNDLVHIVATESVTIGDDVLMASKIFITDCSHGSFDGGPDMTPHVPPANRPLVTAPVVIEDRVWLGDGVVIMPGVRIGAGSVIGANAVVTRDIPPGCVAAGMPARVLRKFSEETQRWERVKPASSHP